MCCRGGIGTGGLERSAGSTVEDGKEYVLGRDEEPVFGNEEPCPNEAKNAGRLLSDDREDPRIGISTESIAVEDLKGRWTRFTCQLLPIHGPTDPFLSHLTLFMRCSTTTTP